MRSVPTILPLGEERILSGVPVGSVTMHADCAAAEEAARMMAIKAVLSMANPIR